jgi:hypothetical protein
MCFSVFIYTPACVCLCVIRICCCILCLCVFFRIIEYFLQCAYADICSYHFKDMGGAQWDHRDPDSLLSLEKARERCPVIFLFY